MPDEPEQLPANSFDVAISYASEDVSIAEEIYSRLVRRGVRVFFDRRQLANLWGKDLGEELESIYRARSKYCLMIVSSAYAEKKWTRHERRSALARALSDGVE